LPGHGRKAGTTSKPWRMATNIRILYDVQKKKLEAAERALRKLDKTTKLTKNEVSKINKKFKDQEKQLTKTTSAFGKMRGAIAPLAGLLSGAVLIAAFRNIVISLKDLELQMSKVAAISGATSKQMIELRNNAIKVGSASKFTATEVGKLQEELARLGFTTTEILKLTDSISALAIVAGRELGPTALAVAKTLNAFALTADEGARVTNVMAESFANSALNLEKFDQAMRNVGPIARVAGLSLEKTTAILGTFVDNGIEASKAGTDLRRILLNVSLAGITLDEAIEKLALSTDKVSTANKLFGARAAVAGILLSENTLKIDRFTESLSDSTIELDRMRRVMEDNLDTDLKKLVSAWDALIQQATPLNNLIRDIVNGLRDWVNILADVEPSTKDLKDQIFETEQQIAKLKKEVKEGGLGFDIFGAKATEAERFIKKLQVELVNLKLELSAKTFIPNILNISFQFLISAIKI